MTKWFVLWMCVAVVCFSLSADEIAIAGRPIVDQNEKAIVTVRLLIKTSYSIPGYGTEQEDAVLEHTGTVVDPSGLVVVSLSATDPAAIFREMFEGMGDEAEGFDYRTELADVKILEWDGTEIPARIVLRDKDLDLAFLRPTAALKEPVSALDLTKVGTPDRLDPVLVLYRMGKVAGRACATVLQRIQAIAKKPRELYFLSDEASDRGYGDFPPFLGGPAFLLDGSVAGIVVLKNLRGSASGGEPESAMIVLPAAQVAEIARQAPSVEQAEKTESAAEQTKPTEPKASGGEGIVLQPDGKVARPEGSNP